MDLLPSYVQSLFNSWADQEDRFADWDEGHKHESYTQMEWESRTENNHNRYRLARVLRHAGRHYVAMED